MSFQVEVWMQLFFLDGSVSEGKRIPAEYLDNDSDESKKIALKMLKDSNREDGYLLIWGAGEISFTKVSVSPLVGSNFLVWETSKPSFLPHMNPESNA